MKRLLLALLFPLMAWAQGSTPISTPIMLGPSGRPLAGATVTVCTANIGIPCSPTASIFQDQGLTLPASNPITTDSNGNWNFWAAPGTYYYTVTGSGITATGPFILVLPCTSGSTCGGSGGGGNQSFINRLQTVAGTALVAGDFALSSQCGTGATVSGVSGTDTAFEFTLTAGTSPLIGCTVTLTYHDGAWTKINSAASQMEGGTGRFSDIPASSSLTQFAMTYDGAVLSGNTYIISGIVTGNSNVINPPPSSINPVVTNPTAPQTITGQPLTITGGAFNALSGGTFGGNYTHSGIELFNILNSANSNAVRYVSPTNVQGWPGSNLGAWINSAEADCAGACLIQGSAGTYTISTATSIGNTAGTSPVSVQFAPGTSITLAAPITVYANSSFLGVATSNANGLTGVANLAPLYITQANGANLAAMIQCGDGTNDGNNCTLMNFQIDGNKTNNASAGPNVLINKSSRVRLAYVTSQNSHSDGFRITATLTGEESAVPKLETILAFQNGGHGLSCINVNDGFVSSGSEFENNTGNGLDLNNCSGWRLVNFDISFNTIGVNIYDSASGGNGSTLNFIDHFIANSNSQQDVFINGWDTGSSSVVNTGNHVTNFILSGAVNRTNQTYSGILSQDSQNNIIGPGYIGTGAVGHAVKYCYEQKLVSSAGTTGDTLNPITCQRGATPLGDISVLATTKFVCFNANGSGLCQYSPIVAAGFAPTLSGTGACATITTQMGAWTGQATCTGTTGASTFTIAFTTAAPHAWQCDASDVSTANALRQSGFTANNCTVSGTVNANDILVFKATAY